jgi:hypothetical protein
MHTQVCLKEMILENTIYGRNGKMEKQEWWHDKDGKLKCFGKPYEFSNYGQSFHCAHLIDSGDCNETLKDICWKRSNEKLK